MLGLVYELMLKTETPPPSHTQAMQYVSCIGLAATSAYQLLFTVPRWDPLVAAPMIAKAKAPVMAGMLWLPLSPSLKGFCERTYLSSAPRPNSWQVYCIIYKDKVSALFVSACCGTAGGCCSLRHRAHLHIPHNGQPLHLRQ